MRSSHGVPASRPVAAFNFAALFTLVTVAFRNLLKAKRRTLLLGFAIAVVAMLFLVLRSVSASVSARMIEAATTLSSGHVNVGGFYKVRKRGADALVNERAKLAALLKEKVPEAVGIIDRGRGWGRIVSPASSLNAGVSGIVWENEGRFFNSVQFERGSAENLKKPNTALLFAAQAKKLEVDIGDTVTLVIEGNGGRSNTVDLEVGAIASDIGFMSNYSLFVPRQTVLDLYRFNDNTTGVFQVYLKHASESQGVMERLRGTLAASGYTLMEHDPQPFFIKFDKVMGEDWLGQQLDLSVWSDEIAFVLWITTALDAVSFLVVGVLAFIIIGGITNAMWMSVRERTKEIGTMRAIGAQKGFIVRMFLAEAFLLGLFAAAVGAALATLLLLSLNALHIPIRNDGVRLFLMTNTFKVGVDAGQILATLALFSVITCVATIYPALKASRMKPVEALMHGK
jgi:putative ABC transport system permease protein